ncbi:hypothetical protein E2C01_069124 [Portunus trituberculatus]|uniref:Uncharacterized protein n=1 Tax=Portunus trituberculatus TaxID=210409 RepID=A0A5B7HYJ4_PORTR|nr:hypothetical protein [Portunus trituberculatus]
MGMHPLLNGLRVLQQSAPKRITDCSQPFRSKMDDGKKAARLDRRLVGVTTTKQLVGTSVRCVSCECSLRQKRDS